jgi:uncharacterized membrane protein YeaQ/YmgE (transglycosylase-associated protein family)
MSIFAWIVVGAVAGYVATLILGGSEGVIGTILLGVVGGLVGGYVAFNVFHFGTMDGINLESCVVATVGALAVIVTWHALTSGRRSRSNL